MSKRKNLKPRPRNGTPEPEVTEPSPTNGASDEPVTVNDAVPFSGAELKGIFLDVEKADSEIAKAEAMLADAKVAKSVLVKLIFDHNGGGPYRYKGRVLRAVKSGESYFFREERAEVQDVG